jgi:hypothetical protein
MNWKLVKIFYWTTFGLSVLILPLNFGLGLFAIGLVILPILVLHLTIGLRLNRIKIRTVSIILSGINLLLFSLIRPDGVHTFTDNGLSSFLDIFGIQAGYNHNYEDHFFIGSLMLLLFQAIMDIRLRKIAKSSKTEGRTQSTTQGL